MATPTELLTWYTPKALATAMPTGTTATYCVPAIVAEIGEMLGAYSKAVRDNWTHHQLTERLVDELGDVAWATAVLLRVQGVDPALLTNEDLPSDPALDNPIRYGDLLGMMMELNRLATYVYLAPPRHTQPALTLWGALCRVGRYLADDPATPLTRNVAKLADRAARGTISGSGDHR